MIEHALYNMRIFLFVQNFQHVYKLWPMKIFARPGQILGRLQLKTMYLNACKTAHIQPFDMISSSKQVFYTLWTGLLHIQKSKNILFWPSYCTKLKLDDLLVGPSRKKNWKETCCHDFFENFLDDYYSTSKYLQLPYFKLFLWRNMFYSIFI